MKLAELATLIRSKNAGPFSLTFDVLFSDPAKYFRVKSSGVLTAQLFADLYRCPTSSVRVFEVDNALAFKVTIPRRHAQGDFGDADLHGGQQHAPIMSIEIPGVRTAGRERIRMSPAELRAFLTAESTMTIASLGPNGRPHLMPVHYYLDVDGRPATWTYASSQKTRNLERDPRATLQVEAGHEYEELRGAMLEANVEIVRDVAEVVEMGLRVVARYGGPDASPTDLPDQARSRVLAQAPKRVGLRFTVTRAVSWDHRKLTPATPARGVTAAEE